jgi:hypothetical protein
MSVDITRPHIGRIYDYVLGGTYNHEADRRAAAAMIELMPAYPRWARQNRSFLNQVGRRWAAEGRTRILDLGSGLPTQGHFNTCLPDARILFSDSDPLTVAQGRQILAYTSDMAYAEADVRDPDALLAQADAFFEGERSLAVGVIGVAYFLSDEHLHALMERLHAFCAPGTPLALSFPCMENQGPLPEEVLAVFRRGSEVARIEFVHRTPAEVAEVMKPWRMGTPQRIDADTPLTGPAHPLDRMSVVGVFAEHG